MPLVLDHPLAGLAPAEYNPREIDDLAIAALSDSLGRIGVVRPLVATTKGRILAGHQRSRALARMGRTTAPVWVMPAVGITDEVRFNQLHNGSDHEIGGSAMDVPVGPVGYATVATRDVRGAYTGGRAGRLNEASRLLAKYGGFSAAVCEAETGRVIVGDLYAHACRTLGVPLTVCRAPQELTAAILEAFGREYGRFSYGRLPRNTWVQSLAQMKRLRKGEDGKGKSRTYENHVAPLLRQNPGWRVLDFGAGQMDYVAELARRGFDIRGVEFYYRRGTGGLVDVGAVNAQIDAVCRSLREDGRFDLVVCDSVLNSVDSLDAEEDVLLTIQALCKPGGTLVFSGRSREFEEHKADGLRTIADTKRRYVSFIDGDGFTGMFAEGVWRYQRLHAKEEVLAMARRFGDGRATDSEGKAYRDANPRSTSAWEIVSPNDVSHDRGRTRLAVAREFDLPLPGGRRYGRSRDVLEALGW